MVDLGLDKKALGLIARLLADYYEPESGISATVTLEAIDRVIVGLSLASLTGDEASLIYYLEAPGG